MDGKVLKAVGGFVLVATAAWIGLLYSVRVRPVRRPKLSLLERWYSLAPQRRRIVACIQNWSLSISKTNQVLLKLQKKHMILRSTFADDVWVPSNRVVGCERIDRPWEQVAEQLLSEYPDSIERLWRVAYTPADETLVIMLDHVLSDGQGLAGIVKDIEFMAKDDASEEAQMTIPEQLEKHVDISVNTAFALSKLLAPKYPKPFIGPILASVDTPLEDISIMDKLKISHEMLENIKKECKRNSTTVHGFICAASCFAMYRLKKEKMEIGLHTPITLRNRVPIQSALGNYVAGTETNVTLSEQSEFWNVAQFVRAETMKQSTNAQRGFGMLMFLPSIVSFLKARDSMYQQGRNGTIEVSNLGSCPSRFDWFFSQGNHYVGPLVVINVVTTGPMNDMFLTFTARSVCVDRQSLRAFVDVFYSLVVEKCNET